MIRFHILIVFLVGLSIFSIRISAQTQVEKNTKYLDSLEIYLRSQLCNDELAYPKKYSKKKLSADLSIVRFLNQVFSPEIDLKKLNDEIENTNRESLSSTEELNGLIKVGKTIISGNYIRVELTIESIDNTIFRKKCVFTTSSNGRCGGAQLRVPDFQLIRQTFIANINFPIFVSDLKYIASQIFLFNKLELVADAHREFIFNLPHSNDDSVVMRIFHNQYNSDSSRYYSYSTAPRDFLQLVKFGRTDIIKDLLFSPNYLYAVNAMEALTYLSLADKLVLDESLKSKFNSLRQATFQITVKQSDLLQHYKGYRVLGMTDDRIKQKYKNSLLRNI